VWVRRRSVCARDQPDRSTRVVNRPHGRKQRRSEHCEQSDREQPALSPDLAPVVASEEIAQRAPPRSLAVDGVASAQGEWLETLDHRIAGKGATSKREVGDNRAIEAREFEHTLYPEALWPVARPVEQTLEIPPRWGAVADESL